jgi:hypothetical protein
VSSACIDVQAHTAKLACSTCISNSVVLYDTVVPYTLQYVQIASTQLIVLLHSLFNQHSVMIT